MTFRELVEQQETVVEALKGWADLTADQVDELVETLAWLTKQVRAEWQKTLRW